MSDIVTMDQATYARWAASVEQLGGVATNWPFGTGLYAKYYGQPAARFDVATYATLYNAGRIDANAPQQTNGASTYAYVLASGVVQQAAKSLSVPTQAEIDAGASAWMNDHGVSFFDPNKPGGIFDIAKYALYAVAGLGALIVLTRGRR